MLVVMHFAATPLFFAKMRKLSVMKIERKQEKAYLESWKHIMK